LRIGRVFKALKAEPVVHQCITSTPWAVVVHSTIGLLSR
jgi:hypothetical protein